MKKLSEIEQKVADYLYGVGITYTVTGGGATNRDGWDCDEWRCVFGQAGKRESFDFYTGIGHREKPALPRFNHPKIGSIAHRNWEIANPGKPVAPCAATVLYSLLLDSSAVDQHFSDWCSEYGLSDYSLKALDIYRACFANAKKLRNIFTRAQLDQLSTMLQDY